MFNKLGTRTLLIVAVVLGLAWFLADRFSEGSQQRTFRSEILRLDTAAVTRIRIVPRGAHRGEIVMDRKGPQQWVITFDGAEHPASHTEIQKLLTEMRALDADRMVGRLSAVEERYELADSLSTRITFTDGGVERSLIMGKRVQANNGPFTYVTVPGEEEVYAIPGNIGSAADARPDLWRPRELITGDHNDWQRITFTYPADSGYVLERDGPGWLVDSMPADSGKVNSFLKSLTFCKAQSFADTVDVSQRVPAYSVTIEALPEHRRDSTRPEPIIVQAYELGFTFVITSNLHPGNVMYFDPQREMPRLFRPRHKWFVEEAPVH